MSQALHFLILTVAGWLQRRMEAQIDYRISENTVYKQRLGRAGLRLTDAQRRRLATKAKAVGRKDLARIATVEHLHGLVRCLVLFVIDLKTTRVEIAGIVHLPYEAWMKRQARNLTDVCDGFLHGKWKLIHDRDSLFGTGLSAMLGSDVTTIKPAPKSPNLNAYAERFVLSIKSEFCVRSVPECPTPQLRFGRTLSALLCTLLVLCGPWLAGCRAPSAVRSETSRTADGSSTPRSQSSAPPAGGSGSASNKGIAAIRGYPLHEPPTMPSLIVTSDPPRYLWINGNYTGDRTPADLHLPPGRYRIAVGGVTPKLEREVVILPEADSPARLHFTEPPRTPGLQQ